MLLKSKLFKEMFRMYSVASQQASTKAPSYKLSCWTQPNLNHQKLKKSRPNPPQLNPTHGSTQPTDNSGHCRTAGVEQKLTTDWSGENAEFASFSNRESCTVCSLLPTVSSSSTYWSDAMPAGTSAGFWLGGQCPVAAWGEENFENSTTKWCILKYIWINMWSA